MRNIILITFMLTLSQITLAARAPDIQDSMDQDAMNQYLDKHPEISLIVKEIDYTNYKIHLKNNCTIIFNREFRFRLPGWVGGAAPLQYSRKICDFDAEDQGFSD